MNLRVEGIDRWSHLLSSFQRAASLSPSSPGHFCLQCHELESIIFPSPSLWSSVLHLSPETSNLWFWDELWHLCLAGSLSSLVSCFLHQAGLILLAAMWRLIVVMPLDVDYVGNCLEEAQEISGDFCQAATGDGAFKQRRWREGIQPDWAVANQWESKQCQRSLHTSYICFQGPVNQLWILQWTRIVQT